MVFCVYFLSLSKCFQVLAVLDPETLLYFLWITYILLHTHTIFSEYLPYDVGTCRSFYSLISWWTFELILFVDSFEHWCYKHLSIHFLDRYKSSVCLGLHVRMKLWVLMVAIRILRSYQTVLHNCYSILQFIFLPILYQVPLSFLHIFQHKCICLFFFLVRCTEYTPHTHTYMSWTTELQIQPCLSWWDEVA